MARHPKFDYDVAVRLREDGWSVREIAAELEVSENTVRRAINPELRRLTNERKRTWQQAGICPICGGPSSRNSAGTHRCRACYAKVQATSVGENGLLRCIECREWKEPEAFSQSQTASISRGFRRGYCRACDTARSRAHERDLKENHPEKYAALLAKQRERQRRRYQARSAQGTPGSRSA